MSSLHIKIKLGSSIMKPNFAESNRSKFYNELYTTGNILNKYQLDEEKVFLADTIISFIDKYNSLLLPERNITREEVLVAFGFGQLLYLRMCYIPDVDYKKLAFRVKYILNHELDNTKYFKQLFKIRDCAELIDKVFEDYSVEKKERSKEERDYIEFLRFYDSERFTHYKPTVRTVNQVRKENDFKSSGNIMEDLLKSS